jgi:scavenger receptor class B, member 1
MRPGSFLFYVWEKPPLEVIMKLYLFNITNAEEFMSGVDKKLKVQEIGPYVYQ